ncbi:MAG: excinuclease ABC subunit UvrC [Clostridia bacterium]|nr:excinuclease ABC subunit UvrC [Clostridia bacterium]
MELPLQPGVYIMKDKQNKIIYIGKAKMLKNRVSQYFGSDKNHSLKVCRMVLNVDDFDYIITDSEYEALVLENSLIKQNKPKYNILLKDDKGSCYIKITAGKWPKITEARHIENDGATYIGPYTSAAPVHQTIDEVQKIFKLPSCTKKFPQDFGKTRPCLNSYIGQCSAWCKGKHSEKEYLDTLNDALEFIRGGSGGSINLLTEKMNEAAENLDFENAAKIRDRITAIKKIREKQKVVSCKVKKQDVIAVAILNEKAVVSVLKFDDYMLKEREDFKFSEVSSAEEIRTEFLRQYYDSRDDIPPRIVVDGETEDKELLEQIFSEKIGRKVEIFLPQKGDTLKLVDMCRHNAAEKLSESTGGSGKELSALQELKTLLGMSKIPEYIESYDISNLAGGENVAGMVVFENGRPLKSAYRKFSIKTVTGQDDYASMQEVIRRRFNEYELHKDEGTGFGRMPDLILLDGGLGHVSAISKVFKEMNISVPLFGMVKDSKHRTRAVTSSGGEITINTARSVYTLISTIQDEVHRYAIGYHRNMRKKNTLSVSLTNIEGIGEKRAKALLKHFGTLSAIQNADLTELENAPAMNGPSALKVYEYFHPKEENS